MKVSRQKNDRGVILSQRPDSTKNSTFPSLNYRVYPIHFSDSVAYVLSILTGVSVKFERCEWGGTGYGQTLSGILGKVSYECSQRTRVF
jgi:hypothetical protein